MIVRDYSVSLSSNFRVVVAMMEEKHRVRLELAALRSVENRDPYRSGQDRRDHLVCYHKVYNKSCLFLIFPKTNS